MKFLVGVNTLTSVDSRVYANHCQLWFRLAKQFPDDKFAFFTPNRSSIDRMRNQTAKFALDNDFDRIIFIDDDVLVPFNAIQLMVATDYDVIAGIVVIRGYPFNMMFFKRTEDGNLTYYNDYLEKPEVILDVAAVGFSCVMIKCDLLKKINPPFFITGQFHTEDVYFCMKAKEEVPDVKIGVHKGISCGHLGDRVVYIPEEKEKWLEFEKPNYPEPPNKNDRPKDYYDKCLNSLSTLAAVRANSQDS